MADDLIPNQVITLVSCVIGLLCLYVSNFSVIGGVCSMVAALLASILGANTLRKIGKYSLGTGVPSIVYMLTAIALLSFVLSLSISMEFNLDFLFPVLGLVLAVLLSYVISLVCRYVFKIQVEVLSKSFVAISVASVLLMMAASTLISQSYNPQIIYETVIGNGVIILIMIMSVMVIQNPYNACMGPNEDQYRTLSLALSNTSLMLMVISIISMLTTKYWILYLLLSVIVWFISFRRYIIYTKHQAASIRRYGLWPKDDGEH